MTTKTREELEKLFSSLPKTIKEEKHKEGEKSALTKEESKKEEIKLPSFFSELTKEDFLALPPEVQKILLDKDNEFQEKTTSYEELKKEAEGKKWIDPLFSSQAERLQKAGVSSAEEWMKALAQIDTELDKNPQVILEKLASLYQVSFPSKPPLQKGENKDKPLFQKALSLLKSFDDAVDEAGTKKHPFFNDVSLEMASLLKNKLVSSLEEAYEKAVWLNPKIRNSLIEEKTLQKIKKKVEESEKAKEASFSVKGKMTGQSDLSKLSTRDLLEFQFRNLD
ncbi:MAG: hypothetical protein PHI50_03285 [Alphaproteobacteria bacterium]|nr:hypothetical protein [Alphaproteobacteria bacterium]